MMRIEQMNQLGTAKCPPTARLWWQRVACGLALLAGVLSASAAAVIDVQEVRVARVVDGDTVLVLDVDSLLFKVRLHGIDAPECDMPFGPQAQKFLAQLTQGRVVQIAPTGRDRYRRMVATMTINGLDVGLTVVRSGFAWRDSRYDKPRSKGEVTSYSIAQRDAQVKFLGLWAGQAPLAPWIWRKEGHRSSPRQRCLDPLTKAGRL